MQRCFALARLGAGNVAPNPMVGAVLVHADRIIGEGYHMVYGQAHAEVNCINSVAETDRKLISSSTMYVSLEPCAHYGKTPPCANLIIRHAIPRVVIGCTDSFEQVAGKGIQKLLEAGVEVITGVLEPEALSLNSRFFTFHTAHRPYIILKWAQSGNQQIGAEGNRVLISNEFTNRIVHRWRAEEAAIMVGTNTALLDDPSLTVRHWEGNDPVRLVIDKQLKLPATAALLDNRAKTIIFNNTVNREGDIRYVQLSAEADYLPQIMSFLFQLNIQSILVEGGAKLLQSFIDAGYWDEARVITNTALQIPGGISAPALKDQFHVKTETILSDTIQYYQRRQGNSPV